MFGFKFKKTEKYLIEEKNLIPANGLVLKVFQELRIIIQKYMYFVYNTELLGDVNQYGFFSVDESLFAHCKNKQVLILGIIDNTSKDFR